jgi:hypothetical protein
VLAERGVQSSIPETDENPGEPDPSNNEFLQNVGDLLQLTEEYEEDLRLAASFTSTIPENAVLVRAKIADTICDLYRDPLDEKKRSVQLDLPTEKLRLGFVELDTAGGAEIFGSYRSPNAKLPVDSKAPWSNQGLDASLRRAGRVFIDDQNQADRLDSMGSSFGMKTFFDSASESTTEEPKSNSEEPDPHTEEPEANIH